MALSSAFPRDLFAASAGLGRRFLGIELCGETAEKARRRLAGAFSTVSSPIQLALPRPAAADVEHNSPFCDTRPAFGRRPPRRSEKRRGGAGVFSPKEHTRWPTSSAPGPTATPSTAGIPYVDDEGRAYDFHALRHQFITDMVESGVHPKDAQALARHSTITLTLDRYAHVRTASLHGALEKLPRLTAAGAGQGAREQAAG